jgi:hypothetical protein
MPSFTSSQETFTKVIRFSAARRAASGLIPRAIADLEENANIPNAGTPRKVRERLVYHGQMTVRALLVRFLV